MYKELDCTRSFRTFPSLRKSAKVLPPDARRKCHLTVPECGHRMKTAAEWESEVRKRSELELYSSLKNNNQVSNAETT